MPHIEGSITIARPPAEVFDFVSDERNEPQYNPEMTAVEKLTDGPIGVGTRWSATVQSRGRATTMELEVTEFARPFRIGSVSTMTTASIAGVLTFTPAPGGTRMSWSWDLRPKGAVWLLSPLFAALGRKQEQRIWGSLKQLLEGNDGAPSGS